jgi:two-component system cell cycle sensor histidine kinase/response regulator CckA
MTDRPTYEELEQRVRQLEKAAVDHQVTVEALKESEARYRQLFNIAPVGIYEVDYRTGKLVNANRAVCEYSGYTKDELLSMSGTDLLTEKSQKKFLDRMRRVLRGESISDTYDYEIIRKDGRLTWMSISNRFIYEGEKIVGATVVARDITDKKKSTEALRESAERLQSVFRAAPTGIGVVAERGLTQVNERICEMTGYSEEELIGQSSRIFYPCDEDYMSVEREKYRQITEHGTGTVETRWRRRDGSVIDVLLSSTPLDFNDLQKGVTFTALDITARKQAELEMRKNANFTQSLLEAIPTPVFYKDIEGRYLGCNRAFTEIMGVAASEIQGKTAQELWPGKYAEVYHQKDLDLMQNPEHQVYEFEVIDKDNHTRPVIFAKDVFRDENGNVAGLLGAFLDITELKQAEEALRSSHERFLTVLDSVDATVYVADMDTHEILFMNKKMVEVFGRNRVGERCWKRFRGESGPCPECTNSQLIDEDQKPTGVCIWQGKNPVNGKWYINHDRAIEWTDGRLVRLQIATDITDLKSLEQQVQQAQKFEAIGTLAGGVAHDFNNLLMGIQGRASLLSSDLSSGPGLEHTRAIEKYIRSATDLTQQLLGLARGGKYEVRPTDFTALMRNSAKLFGRARKEIRIHMESDGAPLVVEVDQGQIDQVLLNLYVNAWQAMPKGGDLYLKTEIVDIENGFGTSDTAKPGKYVLASVTDTGTGMPHDIQQQVFDPFFTTKEKGRGTGLGLASAYGIIKNHDGMITVDSTVGQGTTFRIYLPLSDKAVHERVTSGGELVFGTGTILLVDDETMILEVGQAMLEKLGYTVLIANSGQKALDTLQARGDELKLVVLDLIMPGMDGGEVFDRIRDVRPHLPVLLSSGYAINGQANEIMQRGCNGFIQKPFNIADLSRKLRKILDDVKPE